MFGILRKDFKDDIGEAKKLPPTNITDLGSIVGASSIQKRSPVAGDDHTKGDNHTQNTQDGSGTHTGKYARMKSGLKPIRPSGYSASSLNPTTPGRPGFNPVTPGKLPQTPRLNFKENEPSRFVLHEFPSTPKFARSESTPELHRMRNRIDVHNEHGTVEKTKGHNQHILQESNISNLLALTSDSLPDIFRGPAGQSPLDALHFQPTKCEEKVSKWGYGPSTAAAVTPCPAKPLATGEGVGLRHTPEDNQVSSSSAAAIKPLCGNPWIRPVEKLPLHQQNPSTQKTTVIEPSEPPPSLFSRSLDQSETASALGLSTQHTVKAHPHHHLSSQQTPLVSSRPVQSSIFTPGISHAAPDAILSSNPAPVAPSFKEPIQQRPQPHEPPIPVIHRTAEVQAVNAPPSSLAPPSQNHQPAVANFNNNISNPVPPPGSSSRPPSKAKLITVNGKVYTVMKQLGRGGSSVVYQVLNPEMTDVFALKVVRLDSVDPAAAEGYVNEVRLLKQLQGLSRVVRLLEFEYNADKEKLLLVMEKGDTDFATVIRNRTSLNAINPTLIRFFWQEMLESVREIHDNNVIHTDLKPANFLLVNGGLKLIDFGIATSIQADMTSIMKDSQCGTYNYMAPEAIKSASPVGANQEYKISRKTDVWSLGCMLYSLIYKNPPFNKFRDTIEKINAIVDDRHVIDFPPTADPQVIDVLRACLDRNPRNRPTIEQLLAHPYITGTNKTSGLPANTKETTGFNPNFLRSQLDPFMKDDGHLTDEAKEWIRKWM